MAASPADIFEWARFVATIVTPFAVMLLGAILGSRAQSRKRLMEDINNKIDQLSSDIKYNHKECHEDIQAITVQVASFQRDVAERYPLRGEFEGRIRELREEIREWRHRT